MKLCAPRNWYDRRVAIGAALLIVAMLIVCWLTMNVFIAALFVALYAALDWLLLNARRDFMRAPVHVDVRLETVTGGTAMCVDGLLRMIVDLKADQPIMKVLAIPLAPSSVGIRGMAGTCGSIGPSQSQTLVFEFTAQFPDVAVFPGILLRIASPFRLFSRARLLPCRRQIVIMPNQFAVTNPSLTRLMRRLRSPGQQPRHALRGFGTDFHELRPYQYPDSPRRVDWKATARRQSLIVREFEEPREFTIRVILDASIDMTHGSAGASAYANAAALIARLATLAHSQAMTMWLTAYDRSQLYDRKLGAGARGLARMLSDVAAIPRQSLVRKANQSRASSAEGNANDLLNAALRRFGALSLKTPDEQTAECLADLDPASIRGLPEYCPQCGTAVFADESRCVRCSHLTGVGDLPMRAACAADALARAIRRSRGREMLIFVSVLQGGEACPAVADFLRHAARDHSSVHVVLPALSNLLNARPRPPGSMGQQPITADVLHDINKLDHATRLMIFHRRLIDAGVSVHSIENHHDLDTIIESLLLKEVLAA